MKQTGRLVILLGILFVFSTGCSTLPNRETVGERFPSVTAETLEGRELKLPEALAGAPAILLVGYVQETQFDIDRWLIGLMQVESPIHRVEVPTIPGLLPGLFAGKIDDGMRSGIPTEDWAAVATVYKGDASLIAEFTGQVTPRNARVLLLDAQGQVRWFHDRGFSPAKLFELDRMARSL